LATRYRVPKVVVVIVVAVVLMLTSQGAMVESAAGTPPGEWCGPGYWRQAHHLGSWDAAYFLPDMLFSAIFGEPPELSKLGQRRGVTDDPTLWQVLQSPQYYGGEAFNLVADLLSDAHPGVNFLGERVEDSCPLGRPEPNPGAPPRETANPGRPLFLPLVMQ
jgi:hypothetical protein